MNKRPCLLLTFLALLSSCDAALSSSPASSSENTSSASASSQASDPSTFEEARKLLSDQVSEDTVVSTNQRAIELGLYKPMFDLSHHNVTRIVYPYAMKRQLYHVLDPSKFLVLDKPITAADHASMIAQNLTNKASAITYLKGLGYTMKNEATLPYVPFFDDAPITQDAYAQGFLSRRLFVADEFGALQDDVASLMKKGEKEFVLTLKEGITWRDAEGKTVGALTADDVLKGFDKTLDHGFFQEARRESESSISFTAKESLGLDEAKWAIAVTYGSPKPSTGESLFLADGFTSEVLGDGYRFIKDGFTLNLRRRSEGVDFDLSDATEKTDSVYFVGDRINHGLKTYGFALNPNQGNDAYRAALDNAHFRKATLALLRHSDIKTLTHNSAISRGYYDGVSDTFSPTNQSGRDLPPVISSEGIEEAASQFALALQDGLPEDTIELYVGDVSCRKEKVALLQSLAREAFGDRVEIIGKEYADEQYYYSTGTDYPYIQGRRTFYYEIELDGFYFPTASSYVKAALSTDVE